MSKSFIQSRPQVVGYHGKDNFFVGEFYAGRVRTLSGDPEFGLQQAIEMGYGEIASGIMNERIVLADQGRLEGASALDDIVAGRLCALTGLEPVLARRR